MKKCEKRIAPAAGSVPARPSRSRRPCGVTLRAGPGAHQAVDDDPVARRRGRARTMRRPPAGRARAGSTLGTTVPSSAHGQHHLARLVGDDGAVGDQDRVVLAASRDARRAELAGRDNVGVGEDGAGADRAAALVDLTLSTKFIVPCVRPVRPRRPDGHGRSVSLSRVEGSSPRGDGALIGEEVAPRSCRR